jgi:hypothetical protein
MRVLELVEDHGYNQIPKYSLILRKNEGVTKYKYFKLYYGLKLNAF